MEEERIVFVVCALHFVLRTWYLVVCLKSPRRWKRLISSRSGDLNLARLFKAGIVCR